MRLYECIWIDLGTFHCTALQGDTGESDFALESLRGVRAEKEAHLSSVSIGKRERAHPRC